METLHDLWAVLVPLFAVIFGCLCAATKPIKEIPTSTPNAAPDAKDEPVAAPVAPTVPPTVPESEFVPPSSRRKLYDAAYAALGKRMGLDPAIPKEVNCANAITHVMKNAGVKGLPAKGIPGTASLYAWLRASSDFQRVDKPLFGDIIVYPTGVDAPEMPGLPSLKNGHAFIAGKHQLMSNNSLTGKWDTHWKTLAMADDYYRIKGGLARHCYRWVEA